MAVEMNERCRVQLTRVVRFCAAHRYHSESLSEEENRAVFGKCNRPHGHGHDYRVEVSVRGEIDPQTGMVINLADLDRILQEHVVEPLDHCFLNYDVEYFAHTIPTCENLTLFLYERLGELLDETTVELQSVRVWEGADLFAEVTVEELRP